MILLRTFSPIILFILIYVGTGLYLHTNNVEGAFYVLSPVVAIIPAIIFAWVIYKGSTKSKMEAFLDGMRHKDIITMCVVFLLAGAFSQVTNAIGAVDSTVNFSLSIIPPKFLLIGIFITSAFISTSIGTSMGTIATIGPIAAGLAQQGAFDPIIGIATVVGGAMFGDNLSIISDTTIASVMSQNANMKEKFKINFNLAMLAALLTIIILYFLQNEITAIKYHSYSLLLISPYLLLLILAISGMNVFVVLTVSIIFTYFIGLANNNYNILDFTKHIAQGFTSMNDIMLLSLLVGGLSGLVNKNIDEITDIFTKFIGQKHTKIYAKLMMAKIASLFDILLANNVVAIIFSGNITKIIGKKYNINPNVNAAIIDIFSCIFQGIIPYGAQILLASSFIGSSPISIVQYVFYCYNLLFVSLIYILFSNK